MGSTTPYGFRFPGRTAVPDVPADLRNLAEDVNDEIARVDSDSSSIDTRVTDLETTVATTRWRHIDGGVETGAAFDITVPSGFDMLYLYLLGDLDGNGTVRLRVNGDTTSALHRTGMLVYDALGNLDDDVFFDATTWYLADWGTVSGNVATATIYSLNVAGGPAYHSTGARHSASATGHRLSHGWGQLNDTRLISSLNVRPFSDASNLFATVHWRLEGYASS